jgi:hypothetical protein
LPQNGKQFSTIAKNKLTALDVTLVPFDVDEEVLQFPCTPIKQWIAERLLE